MNIASKTFAPANAPVASQAQSCALGGASLSVFVKRPMRASKHLEITGAASLVVIFLILFPPWCTTLSISQPHEVASCWIGSPPPPFPDPGSPTGLPYHVDRYRVLERVTIVILSTAVVISGVWAVSKLPRSNQTTFGNIGGER
jgi:hypothetical protein